MSNAYRSKVFAFEEIKIGGATPFTQMEAAFGLHILKSGSLPKIQTKRGANISAKIKTRPYLGPAIPMETVLLLFLTACISALGSLQLGPVNASVLRKALKGQFADARWLALGGSLPEWLYASVALFGSHWLLQWENVGYWINLALVPLFLGMGLKLILSKAKPLSQKEEEEKTRLPLLEGFALGMLNPQLPLFWISILVWYKMNLGIAVVGPILSIAFIVGTGLGAFGLLLGLVELCRKYQERVLMFSLRHPPEIWIGLFFVVLAIVQAVKLF